MAADDTDILIVTDAGYGKRTKLERFNRQARGGQGVRGIRLTGKRGSVVAAFMVALDEEILLVSSGGVVIRTAAREIASQGRDATGVRVMNLDDGQSVAAVARVDGGDRRGLSADGRPADGATRPSRAQKMWREEIGQTRSSTLPTMSDSVIGPQYRLSQESVRLSPITK